MIYKGNTLDNAIKNAELNTGKPSEELVYTVLEHKKGFLKNVEFSIEVKGFKSFGALEIVNGQLKYIYGELLPTIEPGENVKILVNDNMILAPTKVSTADLVLISVNNSLPEKKVKVDISDDYLEAYIDVTYKSEKIYAIKNCEAVNHLKVEAELLKETYPEKYSKQELIDILKEDGVKWGVNLDNLEKAIGGGHFLAAAGNKCVPQENDYIKYFFNTSLVKKPMESEGRVDYYNIGEIEHVSANTLLATKYEGHDGKPGCDIRGSIILPKKKEQVRLLKGPGTRLSDDKTSVISIIDGMPSIKNDAVCVYSAYVVNEDLSIKTGNVDFDGDVIIKGSIQEGMKIKSGNNVTIFGDAVGAEIFSAGNIKISRNTIGCNLRAGEQQLNEIEALKHIKLFGEFLIKICQWYSNTIVSVNPNLKENPGMILKMLLDSRLRNYKEIIGSSNTFFNRNIIKDDIHKFWETLNTIYKLIETGKMINVDILLNSLKMVNEFIESYNILLAPADILVQYCQNSTLNATNGVEIKGKGCYNTIITAENFVKLSGVPGVFRGGKIVAMKNIYVGESGSSAGVLTHLRTSKEGMIEARAAYPNTVIDIDDHIYIVESPIRNLKAYLSKGELVVEKLKL